MTESLKKRRMRQALGGWRLLRVTRQQGATVIKPHILFETKEGEIVVSGLYESGYTSEQRANLWRQYVLSSLEAVEVLAETFRSTAPDYDPDSQHYHRVIYALPRRPQTRRRR